MNTDLHFSSSKKDWETPPEIFLPLDLKFDFKVDLAANEQNRKCAKFVPEELDSLSLKWHKFDGWLWLNPPYGRYITDKWVEKCNHEANQGANIVCLLPARTDTLWFHYHVYNKFKIEFIKGRIKFLSNKTQLDQAPFPSMLVYFSKEYAIKKRDLFPLPN